MIKKLTYCLLLVLALSACGQKGPLYLPDTEEDQQSENESSS